VLHISTPRRRYAQAPVYFSNPTNTVASSTDFRSDTTAFAGKVSSGQPSATTKSRQSSIRFIPGIKSFGVLAFLIVLTQLAIRGISRLPEPALPPGEKSRSHAADPASTFREFA
jgi:hypothetical protein